MNPVDKILKDFRRIEVEKEKLKEYCKICGAHVGKDNVYGGAGCSECAYMNEEG